MPKGKWNIINNFPTPTFHIQWVMWKWNPTEFDIFQASVNTLDMIWIVPTWWHVIIKASKANVPPIPWAAAVCRKISGWLCMVVLPPVILAVVTTVRLSVTGDVEKFVWLLACNIHVYYIWYNSLLCSLVIMVSVSY